MHTTDKKEVDQNSYWFIKDNPLSKVGIFPYLGRQISSDLEPDKIYQVLRPEEELSKPETIASLKLIPLVNEHEMLGENFTPAEKKGTHGVTGDNAEFNNGLLSNDLKIFSESLKQEIQNGKKELSAGYFCNYDLTPGEYNGQHYDAVQRDIKFNHIALVEEGRMGHDVRVMDCQITYDTIQDILEIQQKENNMTDETKTAQDVDKRELIREIMAIAAKPDSDFEGGEEEKIETISKKAEQLGYNPSETGANDEDVNIEINQAGEEEAPIEKAPAVDEDPENQVCDEDEDKRKLIDEIGGILKGKVDEELWRTVIGKAEKLAYNDSETGANDEDPKEEKTDEEKPVSMDSAIKYFAKKDALVKRIRPLIGDNTRYPQMTIPEVVKYACDKLNIKNSIDRLEGYLQANARHSAKVSMDTKPSYNPSESSVLRAYKNQNK